MRAGDGSERTHARRARVLIVGAGPAGSAAALALRARGVEGVVLVEATDHRRRRIGESLLPFARTVLTELDLLADLERQGHASCRGSASAWGQPELAHKDYVRTPYGFGWHLDRRRFDGWLADQAAARGVELLRSTRCISVEPRPGGGHVARLGGAATEQRIVVERVVDATGSGARVARALGSRRRVLDRYLCVYGFLGVAERRPNGRTLLEAEELGWWYAADLPEGEQVVALACEREAVRELALRRPEVWRERLAGTAHVSARAGTGPLRSPLLVRPVLSSRLDRVAGPDWLAVGDAAATFDPLCSHGIAKALEDGRDAGAALAASLRGKDQALSSYAERVVARWNEYEQARDALYAFEQRWPAAPFWARRRARAHAPARA